MKCLGKNIEEYITFSVPTKKELDDCKTVTCKLKFIDSFRFISTSLSSLVKCLKCNKNNNEEFNKDLIKRFAIHIYEFCKKDVNKFILLLKSCLSL